MPQNELDKLIETFGEKFAKDLNRSLNTALKFGGSKNVQEAAIHFEPKYTVNDSQISIEIVASDTYWKFIEYGRKPGKMPPSSKLGKKWQVSQGIDPRKALYEISIKKGKQLNKPKKILSYDKASKQFAFIVARSIGKKGLKPRPYLDRVVNDGRLTDLAEDIAKVLSKNITIELKITK